tara:strand:- start:2417 stop:3742 length:1326 start_codon:yes stop_codon:yes gene_type:complete
MALGLGQLLGGVMLGQMTGLLGDNKKPEQQANNTQQGFGGFGGIVSNVSNQMFKGMSQEQVARLGQGFNSMTLRPDQGMHQAFQNRIDNATVAKGKQNAIAVLRKQGKNAIADMLEVDGISVKDAMAYAIEDMGKGDFKATLKILRSDPLNEQALDLADILEADPTMNDEVWNAYMAITGLDGQGDATEYALGVSEILTDQETGQHYQIQTNKATGKTTKVLLDSYGETNVQKDERERQAKLLARDEQKAAEMGEAAYNTAQDYFAQIDLFEQALSTLRPENFNSQEDYERALTGVIQNRLPSTNPNTSLLRGIQNQLGIRVINSATFGALSEREMEMAMRTNLDLTLPPDELIVMIKEQIRVRRKLAMEFSDQALMLLTGGDGKFSTFATEMLKRQEAHNKVIWGNLNQAELDSLLQAGIDEDAYMDKPYEWRKAWFDAR